MAMTQETIIAAAALVATIALGLLAYTQARRAFARTKACLLAEFLPSSDVGIAFLITIRNTGKYPAFIETVSLRLRTGALIPFRNLHGEGFTSPLRVTDEAPASLYFPIASLMHEIPSPLAVRRIKATTTTGRSYSFPGKPPWSVRGFSRHIRSRWTEEHQRSWEDGALR